MLFKSEHIEMIKNGEKKVTRRDWKQKMAKEDGIYPVQEKMFQPKDECDVFIVATGVYKQKLERMNERDAKLEGGYTLEEFKQVWKNLNDEWDPKLRVYVVEFYPLSPEDRKRKLEIQQ